MNTSQPSADARERELFLQALERRTPQERAAFLDGACGNDAKLRANLEELLASHKEDSFLEKAALATSETVLSEMALRADITEKPGDRIGRYKLLQKIGEGGCGVVYMAEQTEPVKRRVALKVIKLGMDTRSVIARFEAERQALALMDHANIAKVLDAGATETGRPYFVMELVRGMKITEYCDETKLPTRQRLDLFIQVCQAVQHAHQKGIIHRDIKPSNILVTVNDGVPVPKVIDFGIAKATNQQQLTDKTLFTAFEQFIGTPAYMSPEQAVMTSLDIDTRSDIYSLGVLLYEMLTGQTPLDAKELLSLGLDEMRRAIREKEPVRPSTRLSTMVEGDLTSTAKLRQVEVPKLIHQLRGDLDWIVMKALEKDRARRYETANGLAMDILRHLNNEPIVARPPSAAYRFQKMVRRNKLVFASAAAIALVLVLGIIVSVWQAARAVRARDEAKVNERKAQQAESVANIEKNRADEQAKHAEQNAAESRERLVRLNVANGSRLVSEGDLTGALLWFVEALKLDENKPVAEETHRVRIGSVVRQCPQLVQLWFHKYPVHVADFSPDGRHIAAVAGKDTNNTLIEGNYTREIDGELQVWDTATGSPVIPPLPFSGIENNSISLRPFSPDGRRVVTIVSRETLTLRVESEVRIADATSGQLVVPPLLHAGMVYQVSFSPDSRRLVTACGKWVSHDGHRIANASGKQTPLGALSGEARVWDAQTGQPISPPLVHRGPVIHASFSPDSSRVITASTDRTARIWDAVTGEALTPPITLDGPVMYAEFSHDGDRVVTASRGGDVQVWNAFTAAQRTPVMKHFSVSFSALFSPDDHWIVTACYDNNARVWDAATGQLVCPPLKHEGGVDRVVFSPQGQRVLTSRTGITAPARIWDAEMGSHVGPPFYHSGVVSAARFSPDGHRVLTAGYDQTARLWDLAPVETNVLTLTYAKDVNHAEFSRDGRFVVTAGRTARLWNAETGTPVAPPLAHSSNVVHAAFSPDGRLVVTASEDHSARVWDALTGSPITAPILHRAAVVHAEFSPDSRFVVTASRDNTSRIWNAATGEPITPPLAHSNWVAHAVFSPDGGLVATASLDGTARTWDSITGRPISPPVVHMTEVHQVSFSPDGRKVVTSSSDKAVRGEARIWDPRTGKVLVPPLQHWDGVMHAAFSPDGKRVVTASEDATARVWDANTGKQLTGSLRHGKNLAYAEFSPDPAGRFVVTASWDNTARVWNGDTGELIVQFPHKVIVWMASFSPDGRHVVTVSDDGTAKIWSLPRENRPVEDLALLAKVLSARQIDQTSGGLEPVDTLSLSNAWQTLRVKYPREFGAALK